MTEAQMIEAMTRAMCHYPTGPSPLNSCCNTVPKRCQLQARAALNAIREHVTIEPETQG